LKKVLLLRKILANPLKIRHKANRNRREGLKLPKRGVAPKRRSQLLDAAFDCMAQKGYGNFSLKEVAEKAALSKGIIHYYFKDKGELLILLLDRLTQSMDELVNQKAIQAKSPPGRIKAIFEASFEVVSKKRMAFFQVLMDFCGQATKNEEIRGITAGLYARYRRLTKKILEDGIEEGIFKPVDTDAVSTALVGTVIGVLFQYMLDEEAFDLDRVQRICEELILNYVSK